MGKTNRFKVNQQQHNIRLGQKLYCYDCNNFQMKPTIIYIYYNTFYDFILEEKREKLASCKMNCKYGKFNYKI